MTEYKLSTRQGASRLDLGQVRMRELKEKTAAKVFDQELQRRVRPAPSSDAGSIELFD